MRGCYLDNNTNFEEIDNIEDSTEISSEIIEENGNESSDFNINEITVETSN